MFPRVIHQLWFQGEQNMPDHAKSSRESWVAANPGYTYRLWDEESIREFLEAHNADFLPTWLSFKHMHQKIDTARLAILVFFGGIFTDMDTVCRRGLEPLLVKYDKTSKTLLLSEFPYQNVFEHIAALNLNFNRTLINNGVQIAKPGCAVLRAMLEITREKHEKHELSVKFLEISQIGGVGLMTNVIHYDEYKDEVAILPHYVLEGKKGEEDPAAKSGDTNDIEKLIFVEHNYTMTWCPSAAIWIVETAETLGVNRANARVLFYLPPVLLILIIYICLRRFYSQTIAALFVLAATTTTLTFFSTSAHSAYVFDNNRNCTEPLDDKLFDVIPETKNRAAIDFFFYTPHFLFLGSLLLFMARDKRLFVVFAVCSLIFFNLREFTNQLTAVPTSESGTGKLSIMGSIIESFKTRHTTIRGSTDMIFSGHTGILSTALLFWMLHLGVIDIPAARLLYMLVMCIFVAGFVAMRLHYSVDIALGLLVSLLVFGYARAFYQDKSARFMRGTTLFNLLALSTVGAFFSLCLSFIPHSQI